MKVNCVVCDDRGCEHCPRVEHTGERVAVVIAPITLRKAVTELLDMGCDMADIRREVELVASEWADAQDEPPVVVGEVRLDRWGKPC